MFWGLGFVNGVAFPEITGSILYLADCFSWFAWHSWSWLSVGYGGYSLGRLRWSLYSVFLLTGWGSPLRSWMQFLLFRNCYNETDRLHSSMCLWYGNRLHTCWYWVFVHAILAFLVWYNALDCLRLSAQEDHDVVVCYIHAFVFWNAGLVVLGLGFVNGMPFPEATCSIPGGLFRTC